MDDMPKLVLVTRQPGERSDRAGDEEEAIALARLKRLDMARQLMDPSMLWAPCWPDG